MPRRRSPDGFTLIELLVVIGIIALLIGILVPVLSAVRRSGKATVCLSNMRQLAQATTSYLLDHRKRFPQPTHDTGITDAGGSNSSADARRLQGDAVWFNALDYYLGEQVKDYQRGDNDDRNYAQYKQDPVWGQLPQEVQTSSGSDDLEAESVRTIKMNEYFGYVSSTSNPVGSSGNPVRFFKLTEIPAPSETALYGDGRAHDTPSEGGNVDTGGSGQFFLREIYMGLRHEEGANLVLADSSARFVKAPIRVSSSGYLGWHDRYDNVTYTDEDRALWPEVFFNFRPEDFDLERRY